MHVFGEGMFGGPPKSGCLTFLSKTNATSHQLAPTSLPYLCTLSREYTSAKENSPPFIQSNPVSNHTSNCTLSQIHGT